MAGSQFDPSLVGALERIVAGIADPAALGVPPPR